MRGQKNIIKQKKSREEQKKMRGEKQRKEKKMRAKLQVNKFRAQTAAHKTRR